MKPLLIRGILGVALVGTLVAGYFSPEPAGDAVGLTARTARSISNVSAVSPNAPNTQRPAAIGGVEVLTIQPRTLPEDSMSVFQVDHPPLALNEAPVMAEQDNQPPPPPQAPPLPLKVLGRYVDDGKEKIFLQYNDQSLVVKVGDSIGDLYRVEDLSGGLLTVRYLPLNQKQTLEVGVFN